MSLPLPHAVRIIARQSVPPALAVLSQLFTGELQALISSGGFLQSERDTKQEGSGVDSSLEKMLSASAESLFIAEIF